MWGSLVLATASHSSSMNRARFLGWFVTLELLASAAVGAPNVSARVLRGRLCAVSPEGAVHMHREQARLSELFARLVSEQKRKFPPPRGRLRAPTARGVYVIYDPRGRPAHVGGTPRAKKGIAQRLRDHLAGRSSFVIRHLKS